MEIIDKVFEILKDNGFMPSGTGADTVATNIISHSGDLMVEAVPGVLNHEFLKAKFEESGLSKCVQKVLSNNGINCSVDPNNSNFVLILEI